MDYRQPPRVDHLRRMTTNFGLIQHATGSTPDPKFGYSIDDNARALIVCLDYAETYDSSELADLEEIYFNFLARALTKDGYFHNFYSIDEQPLDEKGSDDSYARAFWALAEAASRSKNENIWKKAAEIWKQLDPSHHLSHNYLRTKSYILLGYCAMSDINKAQIWADQLVTLFKNNKTEDWQWFEKSLTYCNAIPVYALSRAAEIAKNSEYLTVAQQAFTWLDRVSRVDGIVAPIGQNGWYHHQGDKSIYDQQPVDTAKMVMAADKLFKLTGNKEYQEQANEWMNWYYGENTQNKSAIDSVSYGVYDAITPAGVNTNEGAESIVTYLLAYLRLAEYSHELKYTYFKNLERKISDLLKSLGLEIDYIYCDVAGDRRFQFDNKSGHETGHHYFLARVVGKEGKQVIKVQLDYPDNPDHIFIESRSFTKEQRFYKDNVDSFTYVPRYINSGRFEDLNWLVYEYCEGSTLGLAHTTTAVLNENQVDSLVVLLSRMPDAIVTPETALKTKDGAFFTSYLEAFLSVHHKVLNRIITDKEQDTLLRLNKRFAEIVDGETPLLVHGDFHPGNIIISPDQVSASVIDWENAHMGTPVMDLALIWIRAWGTDWRDQLIELGKKNLDINFFDEQIRYLTLHLLLDELVFWYWIDLHPEITPLSAVAPQALAIHMKTFRELIKD